MTRIRRIAVLLGTAAAVLGGTLPADASFASSASTPTMAISSVDVLAPANVSTGGSSCLGLLNLRLSWTASSTPEVTGYLITVYRGDGTSGVVATTHSAATSFSGTYFRGFQTYRFTVTTLTSYGWTEESVPSGVIKC